MLCYKWFGISELFSEWMTDKPNKKMKEDG